jgi:DNA primase
MAGDAENLIQKIPIESYIQRFVQLKRKGNNLWAICPFHSEKSPSFSISPEKGIFKCFGCGKGGNLITFVQLYERVDFPEALRLLSEYSGIPLQGNKGNFQAKRDRKDFLFKINEKVKNAFQVKLKQSEGWIYIKNRKISDEAINNFQIGYSPNEYNFIEKQLLSNQSAESQSEIKTALIELGILGKGSDNSVYNRFQGRVIFPIIDVNGHCIGFGGRLIENRENTGKYINSPESEIFSKKNSLYNLNRAKEFIRQAGQVIVVEGYLDVMGLSQMGIENVVAPLGTAFTEEQSRILKRYTDKVILFFDNDNAGIEASFKALQIARNASLDSRVLIQSHAKDPFDVTLSLDQMDILTLLDTAKSEKSFTLWYFFSHKFNIQTMPGKRSAIESFFEFLLKLEKDWEKEEFINEASAILNIDSNSLKNDFRKFSKTGFVYEEKPVKQENIEKIPGIEKEILALLLKYPSFWQRQDLLDELHWTHKSIYLLFIFFRDRLKAGEFWKWDELNQAINILPEELSNILTEIMMEMEEVFINWETSQKNNPSEAESFFSRKLEHLIYLHKKNKINILLARLQKELEYSEKMQDDNTENLIVEIESALKEKSKIENIILKIS